MKMALIAVTNAGKAKIAPIAAGATHRRGVLACTGGRTSLEAEKVFSENCASEAFITAGRTADKAAANVDAECR